MEQLTLTIKPPTKKSPHGAEESLSSLSIPEEEYIESGRHVFEI
jgi:hypothetical protein